MSCGSAWASASASPSRCSSSRIVQRQPVQFVVNSLVGIGIAAVFARAQRQGRGRLPAGHHLQRGLRRRPDAVGPGALAGGRADDRLGHRRPHRVAQGPGGRQAVQPADLVLAVPCIVRVVVQWPLYLAGEVGWLGVAKIALGWPLQVAALAAMVWLLARGRTPITRRPTARRRAPGPRHRPRQRARPRLTVSGRGGRAAPRAAGPCRGWRRTAARRRPRAGRRATARSAGPRG